MIFIPFGLRVILVGGSLAVLLFVSFNAVKEKLDIRYAILWVTWSFCLLLIGIFPQIAIFFSHLFKIQSVTNFLFIVMIALLFFYNYYLYVKASKMTQEIKKLNYEVALLKKEQYEKHKKVG